MSRADKISPLSRMPEYFADFPINLQRNQVTGQLDRLINADSVRQSIVNLVLTDIKERFYQPHVGSRVKESLFDLFDDPIGIDNIKSSVEECIKNNEPRAQLIRIDVRSVADLNGYDLEIHFGIINIQQTFIANVFITRIR